MNRPAGLLTLPAGKLRKGIIDMDKFVSRFFTAPDGLRLHARDYPAAGGGNTRLPLVCLPGLSRNARDFHQFALLVSGDAVMPRRVIALDYRGRGLSAHDADPANYTIPVECNDVIAVCTALGLSRCLFAGTSRGGLILHVMAAVRRDLIAGAILNDIAPEIEAAGLMEIRDYLGKHGTPASFEDAAEGLRHLHGAAFPALASADWLDMAHALYTDRSGPIVADYDPKLTDQLKAIDFAKPLPTLWPQFERLAETPLLVVRGENSRLFSAGTLERMRAYGKTVEATLARGQGHAPLLNLPDVFAPVKAFLARF